MDLKHKIYDLFTKQHRLRFSDIQKSLSITSNKLSYHLNAMIKEGLLAKDEDDYVLTKTAEENIPFFTQFTAQQHGVMPVVICAILHKGNILLINRKKRPYKGYWGMPGAAIRSTESISEAAERVTLEETGIRATFSHLSAVVHERVSENGAYKHAFLLFLAVLKPSTTNSTESDEGKLEWFKLKQIQPARIILSDYHLLKNYLDKKTAVPSYIMEEKDGKLLNLKKIN